VPSVSDAAGAAALNISRFAGVFKIAVFKIPVFKIHAAFQDPRRDRCGASLHFSSSGT